MVMALFVSHSSVDGEAVRSLVRVLQSSGRSVWLDQDLVGGEAWWAAILRQIRECDVFVFALSPNSLESAPCGAELAYARLLGRPILPVEVTAVSPEDRRNHAVFNDQLVDYSRPTVETGVQLMRALQEREAGRRPLPDPLPAEPAIPYEYLLRLGSVLHGQATISHSEQQLLLAQLRGALRSERSESVRGSVKKLLHTMRDRPDTTHLVVTEIDEILGSPAGPVVGAAAVNRPERTAADKTVNAATVAAGWFADPHGDTRMLRWWDGRAWTNDVRPIAHVPVAQSAGTGIVWSILAFVGALSAWIPLWVFVAGTFSIVCGSIAVRRHAPGGAISLIVGIVATAIGVILTVVYAVASTITQSGSALS